MTLQDILDKLKAQDFGPDDSYIASALMNPRKAVNNLAQWLQNNVNDTMYAPYPFDIAAANKLASIPMTGSMPMAQQQGFGTFRTFFGPKATGWDKQAAEEAVSMLDSGVAPEKVWAEKLIGRMPDNSLFSELDDSKAIYQGADRMAGYGNSDKNALFLHKELQNNYPDFKKIDWNAYNSSSPSGSYVSGTKGNEFYFGNPDLITINGPLDTRKSTSLHELQHAIQKREGWAKGESPEAYYLSKGTIGEDILHPE
jgi:hypothetical protein